MKSKDMIRFGFVFGCSLLLVAMFVGCEKEDTRIHSRGFHLPNGDPLVGQDLFVEMKCNLCHTVAGVELPDYGLPSLPKIEIGGKVNRVRSYGELVTSIISPEHVISEKWLALLPKEDVAKGDVYSPMPVFNEELTVQQLVDLATFLYVAFEKNEVKYFEYYYPVIP